jgi:hypothetical protein
VVVARIVTGDRTELLVAPITHSEPTTGEGVEVPPRVKLHLGLDDERSWIIATELNRFTWPGPDVRLVPDGDTPFYGAIPAPLFERLRRAISDHVTANRVRMPRRTE